MRKKSPWTRDHRMNHIERQLNQESDHWQYHSLCKPDKAWSSLFWYQSPDAWIMNLLINQDDFICWPVLTYEISYLDCNPCRWQLTILILKRQWLLESKSVKSKPTMQQSILTFNLTNPLILMGIPRRVSSYPKQKGLCSHRAVSGSEQRWHHQDERKDLQRQIHSSWFRKRTTELLRLRKTDQNNP